MGQERPLGDPIEMGGVAAVLLAKDRLGDSPLLLACPQILCWAR